MTNHSAPGDRGPWLIDRKSAERFGADEVARLRAAPSAGLRAVHRAAASSPTWPASPDERRALLDRVRQLAQTHPAIARQPEISLPYVTRCWQCRRP